MVSDFCLFKMQLAPAARYGVVSCGASLLFADFMNKQKLAPRLASSLADVVAEVGKAGPLDPSVTHVTLSVGACDGEDNDVDIPDVRVRIR